jgi:hypothetical protein
MSPRDGELQRWAGDENPEFVILLDTAGAASEALLIGPEAIRASADQLRAVAEAGRERLASHPCPDPELEERLTRLIERFGFMARSFEAPADQYGSGYLPALGHQLRTLVADLTVFISDLGHAIEGR